MADWTVDYFGPNLVTKDGAKPTKEVLNGKSIVAIYFSAHWVSDIYFSSPLYFSPLLSSSLVIVDIITIFVQIFVYIIYIIFFFFLVPSMPWLHSCSQ